MWRKTVISALIGVILLTASCIGCIGGGMAVPIPPPGITGDNSGGAIVTYAVYETLTEQDYYVQRISPAGDFLWGGRGVLIGSTGNGIPYSEAVSDGSGGAIVSWWECLPRVPGEPTSCQPYVARIDSEGHVQWQWGREGVKIKSMIADGAGGVIIGVWAADTKGSLVKIDSEGNLLWGEDGVSVGVVPEWSDEMASDGSGGVIVVKCTFEGSDTVYAQKVDSQGNILWQAGGVQAYTGPAEQARVASDGAGGAIIAYMRDIPCEDGVGFCDLDIYAQRIDAEGNVLWGSDGVPICTESAVVQNPQIVDDGAGGAIVFWADESGVWARRIDADGHKLWNEDVPLCDSVILRVASDGSGGAFCLSYDRVAQWLDASGTKLWGPDGITFTTRDIHESALALVSDGCGGLLISWEADVKFRNYEVSDVSYYVQRVDADGNLPWGNEGILLNP
jgi:hypothetical protein